ncbi:zinc finger protein 723-like [Maniola hyperantus]|uniref:zinc finger protein 723-like n=1 Tax=Aphantopus hyperantus TaxID=2795564 RepID=UPI002142224F
MDQEEKEIMCEFITEMDPDHPILLIPKHLITFETNCAASDRVFINLKITTADTEGNDVNLYSGLCNIKLINYSPDDHNNGEIDCGSNSGNVLSETINDDTIESERLIDQTYNPYVSDAYEAEENYTIYQSHNEHITVRQHDIEKNVNVQYSPAMEFEHKKFKQMKMSNEPEPQHAGPSLDEHLECGLILSTLSQEIMKADENRARQEMKYVDMPSDNVAVKQLMSSEVQGSRRCQRTILFLGDSSTPNGQTVHYISINDPQAKCRESSGVGNNVVVNNPCQKKYQCDKCKQIFYHMSAFRQHLEREKPDVPTNNVVWFHCEKCNKSFKSHEKFEIHCYGHGNPNVECNICQKVFATKSSLQKHIKIHLRKYKCQYCRKTYQKFKDITAHMEKAHFDSKLHEGMLIEFGATNSDSAEDYSTAYEESNELSLIHAQKGKECKAKKCNLCLKSCDRLNDLKRHLIKHIVESSLLKTVDDSGMLSLTCVVCQRQTFSRITEYKAHLREHAKLTTYKCTSCGKIFSDASNFSKHKKVHDNQRFQCDICLRKFNTKKTLIAHIVYHNTNTLVNCYYCSKQFHYQSSLNKHIKIIHKRIVARNKCKICDDVMNTIKEKWDHEWMVHQVRKIVVDCLLCDAKFRKYSELKRHCKSSHQVDIPLVRKLFRKRNGRK